MLAHAAAQAVLQFARHAAQAIAQGGLALWVGLASTIRGRNPLTDGFGLIAFASLTPMIFVLIYGMVV